MLLNISRRTLLSSQLVTFVSNMNSPPQTGVIVETKQTDVCQEEKERPKKWFKRLKKRITKFGCRCFSGEKRGEVYVKSEATLINDKMTETKVDEAFKGDDCDCAEDKAKLPPMVYNPPTLQELAAKVAQDYVDFLLARQKGRARRRCGFKALYDPAYGVRF